jgi:hypothetical protein
VQTSGGLGEAASILAVASQTTKEPLFGQFPTVRIIHALSNELLHMRNQGMADAIRARGFMTKFRRNLRAAFG